MTKVSRLYYEQGRRQSEIAAQLSLSQSTVSRLLKRAQKEQIVRIRVSAPAGTYPALEDGLQARYGLKDVVVVDCLEDDPSEIIHRLGSAAAYYVEATTRHREWIGISSRSATLLAMLDAMQALSYLAETTVVQVMGSIGEPTDGAHAAHLTRRLAELTHGRAVFLPAPGVVGHGEARQVLLTDPYVRDVYEMFPKLTTVLVGIGATEAHKLLDSQGNFFTAEELEMLINRGAVGNICLRFYDHQGKPVITAVDDRIVGIEQGHLRAINRVIGIAGGPDKTAAIRGALLGRWINVLITDRFTAERLLQE